MPTRTRKRKRVQFAKIPNLLHVMAAELDEQGGRADKGETQKLAKRLKAQFTDLRGVSVDTVAQYLTSLKHRLKNGTAPQISQDRNEIKTKAATKDYGSTRPKGSTAATIVESSPKPASKRAHRRRVSGIAPSPTSVAPSPTMLTKAPERPTMVNLEVTDAVLDIDIQGAFFVIITENTKVFGNIKTINIQN